MGNKLIDILMETDPEKLERNSTHDIEIKRLLGQRHHQKENDDHDQQRYGVVQYPSHSSPRLLLSRRYFSFSSMR